MNGDEFRMKFVSVFCFFLLVNVISNTKLSKPYLQKDCQKKVSAGKAKLLQQRHMALQRNKIYIHLFTFTLAFRQSLIQCRLHRYQLLHRAKRTSGFIFAIFE